MGYDPNYGARPVKRVIQQHIENELAKQILRGDIKEEDTVLVDTEMTAFADGLKLVFNVFPSKTAVDDSNVGVALGQSL